MVIEKTSVQRLAELEVIIERGLETFIEVGRALLEIRDGRLYKESHSNFDNYCRERWKMSRDKADRTIAAANIVDNVTPIGVIPGSESVARELNGLDPEQQREAWGMAIHHSETGDPTAAEVRDAVRSLQGDEAEAEDIEELVDPEPHLSVHFSSESDEWYTPEEIIVRTVKLLGQIDLDPCSNSGDPNIPAAVHYTQEQNGLDRLWAGRVYMNPPYGRVIDSWAAKLCQEYAKGRVSEAIALVPARVDTDWFRRFRDYAVCFIDGRLKFSGHENSAPFPSAVIYLGKRIQEFNSAFADLGDVWIRYAQA